MNLSPTPHYHDERGVDQRNEPTVISVDGPQQLSIDSTYDQLAAAREFVASFLPDLAPVDALYLTALTEVVTNAVTAHLGAGTRSPIEIRVFQEPLVIEVTDTGTGFSPTDDGLPAGGLDVARLGSPRLSWRKNEPSGTVFVLPYPTETAQRS